jgi:hypothetical protein
VNMSERLRLTIKPVRSSSIRRSTRQVAKGAAHYGAVAALGAVGEARVAELSAAGATEIICSLHEVEQRKLCVP